MAVDQCATAKTVSEVNDSGNGSSSVGGGREIFPHRLEKLLPPSYGRRVCWERRVRRRRAGGWGLGGWGRRPQKYTATTPRGSTAEAATFHRRTETRPRELNTLSRCSFPPGDLQKNYSRRFLLFRGTSPIPTTLLRIDNILFDFKSGEPENGSHQTSK